MVFSLPHLPSLPSLRNILDPEPQVLYPPSATNTPLPSPSAKARIKNLPPVPDDWAQERERGRRTSISSSSSRHGLAPPSASPASAGGLGRPTHRRAHSAMPLHAAPVHAQGRLTEFSLGQNLLASTSALSLPTLVEAEADTYIEPGLHRRRGSRSSITSNTSGMSSLPPSPRRPHASLPNPNPTSVPPPVPRTSKRPVLSPRAWSVTDVRPIHEHESEAETSSNVNPKANATAGKGLTRHQSYTTTRPAIISAPARPRLAAVSERRMSSSQVSDVAVLASWHFPDEAATEGPGGSGGSTSGPVEAGNIGSGKPGLQRTHSAMPSAGSSRDLADRLRSLAAIDTSSSTLSTSSTTTPTGAGTNLIPRPFQPKLSHRYTHSSPNLNIYATPPGHRRGLRQPTPLGSNHNLSSSPGSLSLSVSTSDTDSTVEPVSPVGSMASAKWYDLGSKAKAWGRRGSSISVNTPSVPVEVDEVESGLKGLELHNKEEEEEDEEVYIDFDRI
jgi:hypothetical protein